MQDQARIERLGNDIVGPEAGQRAAIGAGHHIAGFGAGQRRDRFDRRHLHRLVDGGGVHVQRAPEDKGEAQDIVDLVDIVGTAGGDDGVGPRRLGHFRQDFRIGIGQRQDQRLWRHLRQPFGLQHIGRRQAQEHVGAGQHFAQGARVGLAGIARHVGRHVVAAVLVHHALDVGEGDVLDRKAHRHQKVHAGQRRRAGA